MPSNYKTQDMAISWLAISSQPIQQHEIHSECQYTVRWTTFPLICWPAITAWRLVYLLVCMENKSRFHSTAGTKWILVWMSYLNNKLPRGSIMPPPWVFATRQRWNWINIYGRWGTSECSTKNMICHGATFVVTRGTGCGKKCSLLCHLWLHS